jgi:hypothetical protein
MDGSQIELQSEYTEIALKLTTHGRYIWNITSRFSSNKVNQALEELIRTDRKLKDKFPNHATRGSGRVSNFEEV